MKMTLGLCRGRHNIPGVEEYIYPNEVNPLDLSSMKATVHAALKDCSRLDLYVTGLTVALIEVVNYCCYNHIPLTLWHFDRDTGEYYPQAVATCTDLDLLVEAGHYRMA